VNHDAINRPRQLPYKELDDAISILVGQLSLSQQEALLSLLIDTMGLDDPQQRSTYVPNYEAAAAQFLAG
jgi:hypothetical protein